MAKGQVRHTALLNFAPHSPFYRAGQEFWLWECEQVFDSGREEKSAHNEHATAGCRDTTGEASREGFACGCGFRLRQESAGGARICCLIEKGAAAAVRSGELG